MTVFSDLYKRGSLGNVDKYTFIKFHNFHLSLFHQFQVSITLCEISDNFLSIMLLLLLFFNFFFYHSRELKIEKAFKRKWATKFCTNDVQNEYLIDLLMNYDIVSLENNDL